jgi:Fic family protein
MSLNKSTSYVLLHMLGGRTTATQISKVMPEVDIRSIQRALTRLVEIRIVERIGIHNNPLYSILYEQLLATDIPAKLLEDENRPETNFNHKLINWLESRQISELEQLLKWEGADKKKHVRMSAKDLEYLTVELSWKSSALEGNTYTLLDTQLLLTESVKAKNRTEFETQMILNHKNAMSFIVENPESFDGNITFATIEELHKIIGNNLGIASGVRKKIVKISASNYIPLANPHQLRENADIILSTISNVSKPHLKALLALSLIPYLQIFEDGNKRTGRMLANAILISSIGQGFSLRKVSAREFALAYLSFYEFNSLLSLSKILESELSH